MSNRPEYELLLGDVLQEPDSDGFKNAVLGGMLEHVRRRRRVRQQGYRVAAAATVVAISAVLFIWNSLTPSSEQSSQRGQQVTVVTSQPLPGSMVIQSQPNTVVVIQSLLNTLDVVRTDSDDPGFYEINDEQLLGLLAGRPAVLLRHGQEGAELRFSNEADREGFEIQ